jgi:hypothetical protein
VSVWLPTAPEIEQSGESGLSDQLTPAGSGSFTVTPWAVVVPVFVTVISNPIWSPALTGPAGLAVFVMSIVGAATVKHSVVAFVCDAAR